MIRLNNTVLTTDGTVDAGAWHTAVAAKMSVGRCDCGGLADGDAIVGNARSATAVCVRCRYQAARPVCRPVNTRPVAHPPRLRARHRVPA